MKTMKKSILTAVLVSFSVVSFSNTNDFDSQMKSYLEIVRAGNKDNDFKQLASKFDKIHKKNKDKYEPLYYSAFCYIMSSWQISENDSKNEVLDQAIKQINKAKELSSNNDELLVLEALYYQAMILTDPLKYGPSLSAKSAELLLKAQSINENNPRAEFLRAQNIYYRPEQFGGGKQKALPHYEKANILFENQKTDNYLWPVWGAELNKNMLHLCKN